jgi:hypothetical protein
VISSLSLLGDLRKEYHSKLQNTIWGISDKGIASNADSHHNTSTAIGREMLEQAKEPIKRAVAQTSGQKFTEITYWFLEAAFSKLEHIRPGPWLLSTSQASIGIAAYHQYEHLASLEKLLDSLEKHDSTSKDLRAMFASGYLITPDIVIARRPISDEIINKMDAILDAGADLATYTPLREATNSVPMLHASISCKWTIRSDRSQNSRTEALNLIRNRKGNTPHIVVVTGEPLPSRIASIALGTGDIDCVYHMALYEMKAAIDSYKAKDESAAEMFETLVLGRRLRDISDLPFDLAI